LTAWAEWGNAISECSEASNATSRIMDALARVTPDVRLYLPMWMK
jgi:hypothetical protein